MFSGPEVWIVLLAILLVFGSSRLPKLARSLGKAQQEFKSALSEGSGEDGDTTERTDATAEPGTQATRSGAERSGSDQAADDRPGEPGPA